MGSSDVTITQDDYRLFLRCPRSLHRRLIGEQIADANPADALYPVRSEREHVREVARRLYAPLVSDSGEVDVRVARPPFAARVDLLHPQKPDGIAAVFVRDATSIKGSYLVDAALVRYCWPDEHLSKLFICHVRKGYERHGAVDPDACLAVHDVTRRVDKLLATERDALDALASLLADDPLLSRFADAVCDRPSSCPVCGADRSQPPADHVSTLYRGGALVKELTDDGYASLVDVPPERLVHPRQRIQQHAVTHRTPHVNHEALGGFMDRLVYPLVYLDFEATCTAIPPYDRVRAWEHIPYLFSVHREPAAGAALTHDCFVMRPGHDDRIELANRLCVALGDSGSVVVYSAGFERGILARLAEVVPECTARLTDAIDRIVDLLDPFNQFSYYHPEQRGKVSLKTILPLLSTDGYANLSISDGYAANRAYRYLCERANDPEYDPAAASALIDDLAEYCTMDTLAMVRVMARLRGIMGEPGRLWRPGRE